MKCMYIIITENLFASVYKTHLFDHLFNPRISRTIRINIIKTR